MQFQLFKIVFSLILFSVACVEPWNHTYCHYVATLASNELLHHPHQRHGASVYHKQLLNITADYTPAIPTG